jgi:hypothetical protein
MEQEKNEMKAQELFDKVVSFMIKQGKPSYKAGTCMYRGPEGTKCAVGCVLTDHYYRTNMEEMGIDNLIKKFILPKFIKNNKDLLRDLQNAHDSNAFSYGENNKNFIENFTYEVKGIAEDRNLKWNFKNL